MKSKLLLLLLMMMMMTTMTVTMTTKKGWWRDHEPAPPPSSPPIESEALASAEGIFGNSSFAFYVLETIAASSGFRSFHLESRV